MKKIYLASFILLMNSFGNLLFAQANSVTLTPAGGASSFFPSITSAYAAIPASPGVSQLIEILAPYDGTDPSEVYPIQLTDKGVTPGGAITITIRPAAGNNGEMIQRPTAAFQAVIQFNGGDNIILDGRPGGVASSVANYLSVNQPFTTTVATASSFDIEITNAANNNTVQFINAVVAPASTLQGARGIAVGTTTTTGNNNNNILNNVVTGGLRGIQDFGTAGFANNGTIIQGNNVSNFASIGIFAGSNQTNISVIANTVFLNNSVALLPVSPATSISITGIQQQATTGTGTITDNIINLAPTGGTIGTMRGFSQIGQGNENILRNKVTGITGIAATTFVGGMLIQNSATGATSAVVNVTDNKLENITDVTSTGTAANVTAQGIGVFGAATVNVLRDTMNNISSVTNVQGVSISTITGQTQAENVTLSASIISNLSATGAGNLRGVSAFPFTNSVLNLNNNFISITQPNASSVFLVGLLMGNTAGQNYTSNLYFNSIRIGGTTNATAGSSRGFGIYKSDANAASIYNQKNNIALLEIDGAAFELNSNLGTLSIDYNTYFANGTNNSLAVQTVIAGTTTDYPSTPTGLTNYKTAINPQEQNTNFTLPNFVSNTDLHLTGASLTDPALNGITIAGITTDIDGQTRPATPTRGADQVVAVVPVSLFSFTGTGKGSFNQLNWITATESNNAGFQLQRSPDGVNFSQLSYNSSKASDGNSSSALNYSYNDMKPYTFNSYYRLKQINRDGGFSYSPVVSIKGKGAISLEINNVYPNPVADKFNLVVASGISGTLAISVTDMSGKTVIQKSFTLTAGDNVLPVNAAALGAGTYIIKAINKSTGETAVTKFVK